MHVGVVAEAHVRATHAAAAGGERIIVSSGDFYYQELRKLFIPFSYLIRKADGTKLSRFGSGARDSEYSARRAGINERHQVFTESRDEKIRGAAWVESYDVSERRGGGVGGGL